MAETTRQFSTGCSYFGCTNHPKIQPYLRYFSFPKDKNMIRKWMLRMNLEYVKPLSACVCADHFDENDMFVSDDGRTLLKDSALPIVYEYNMANHSRDVPSLRMRLLRLNDRPLSSDPAQLECTFCNTAVASNFLDLRKTDQQTLQARRILWLHYGIDAVDIELNVRCICQICWTITHNFHNLHNKIKKLNFGNAVANLDDNELEHPIEFSDVRESVEFDEQPTKKPANHRVVVYGELPTRKPDTILMTENGRKAISFNATQENADLMVVEYLDDIADEPSSNTIPEKSDKSGGENNVSRTGIENWVPCPICNMIYTNSKSLERHMRFSHTNQMPCTKCKRSFGTPSELQIHMCQAHFKPKACKFCNKLFYESSSLYRHSRLCTKRNDALTELCTECGLGFADEHTLKNHVERRHFKSIECDQCGEVFNSANMFRLHKRFHKTPDKFTCAECGKRFRKEISLREHMTTHTGGFIYFCEVCQRPFRHNSNYFTHRRKAHPEVAFAKKCNYICVYCDRRFYAKSGIIVHMKKHIADGFPETSSSDGRMAERSETPSHSSFKEQFELDCAPIMADTA